MFSYIRLYFGMFSAWLCHQKKIYIYNQYMPPGRRLVFCIYLVYLVCICIYIFWYICWYIFWYILDVFGYICIYFALPQSPDPFIKQFHVDAFLGPPGQGPKTGRDDTMIVFMNWPHI